MIFFFYKTKIISFQVDPFSFLDLVIKILGPDPDLDSINRRCGSASGQIRIVLEDPDRYCFQFHFFLDISNILSKILKIITYDDDEKDAINLK